MGNKGNGENMSTVLDTLIHHLVPVLVIPVSTARAGRFILNVIVLYLHIQKNEMLFYGEKLWK
jgi:hypothetical protein